MLIVLVVLTWSYLLYTYTLWSWYDIYANFCVTDFSTITYTCKLDKCFVAHCVPVSWCVLSNFEINLERNWIWFLVCCCSCYLYYTIAYHHSPPRLEIRWPYSLQDLKNLCTSLNLTALLEWMWHHCICKAESNRSKKVSSTITQSKCRRSCRDTLWRHIHSRSEVKFMNSCSLWRTWSPAKKMWLCCWKKDCSSHFAALINETCDYQ